MDVLTPLLEPLAIRGVAIANRIVMSPMTRDFSPAGVPGDDMAAYYARRADGGVGLIVTEGIGIAHDAAVDSPSVPLLHGERALAGWRAVVDAVHGAGGKIIPQLWHQGVQWDAAVSPRADVSRVGPSGLWGPAEGMVSLDPAKIEHLRTPFAAMSDEEIGDVIAAYAASARNAAAIGFDGIALHAGHGYLIDSFLWHETNRRNDRWGGNWQRRSAFAVEVVKAIRREIGEGLPILFRFSQFKMQDYKAQLAENPDDLARLLVPIAEASVDVFDGSQRFFDTPTFAGSTLNLAGWAKKLTGKFAMTVGGVGLDQGKRTHHLDTGARASNNLDRLLERFARGEFDLVAVGRSLLNDPQWLAKARRGEPFLPFDPANLARLN